MSGRALLGGGGGGAVAVVLQTAALTRVDRQSRLPLSAGGPQLGARSPTQRRQVRLQVRD